MVAKLLVPQTFTTIIALPSPLADILAMGSQSLSGGSTLHQAQTVSLHDDWQAKTGIKILYPSDEISAKSVVE
jgi:hypothetical protein